MKVTNEIAVYELAGKETTSPYPTMNVVSHWNRDCMVIVEVDGKRYTVVAQELIKAIGNATNWRGW